MPTFNVRISQESEIGSKSSYSVHNGSMIRLQRPIYNNLKSLMKNSIVEIPENQTGDGYIQFLEDMSILHEFLINDSTEPVPDGISLVDEYLGELGIDDEYMLKKDIIQLNKFLNADYIPVEIEI